MCKNLLSRVEYIGENYKAIIDNSDNMNSYEGSKGKVIFYDNDIVIRVFDSMVERNSYCLIMDELEPSVYFPCKYIRRGANIVVMERIKGKKLSECTKKEVIEVLNSQFFDLVDECVQLGYKPYFNLDDAIIDEEGKLKIIDISNFERITNVYDKEDVCSFIDCFYYLSEQIDYLDYEEVLYDNGEFKERNIKY